MRLIRGKDAEEEKKIGEFKDKYKKLKPIKYIAITLYTFLPIFETPAWCINTP